MRTFGHIGDGQLWFRLVRVGGSLLIVLNKFIVRTVDYP
jgi:hypothetical protein